MSDTLTLFGIDYPDSVGFKAKDDLGTTHTYSEGGGGGSDVLVVTLSWDDDYFGQGDGAWIPDCTYAEIAAAYSAGKDIVVECNEDIADVQVSGTWLAQMQYYVYAVTNAIDSDTGGYEHIIYVYGSNGISIDASDDFYYTGEATISSNSQLLNGITAVGSDGTLYTGNIPSKTSSDLTASGATVTVPAGHYASQATKTISSGTEGTPTATKGTASNHAVTVTPSVTNSAGYISGGTHTGTGVSVSASELVSGTYTVDSSGTKDVTNYASASVPEALLQVDYRSGFQTTSGNRQWWVTPYTTSMAYGYNDGWFGGSQDGGTFTYNAIPSNTTITTSASEQTIGGANYMMEGAVTVKAVTTTNLTADNIKSGVTVQVGDSSDSGRVLSVTGTYSGGGGSSVQVSAADKELSSAASSISFTGLSGEPTSFFLYSEDDLATGASPFKVAAIAYDGTSLHGQTITNTSNAQVTYDGSSFSKSYSNGTLTITSTGAYFQPVLYSLVYTYGGTAACIDTKDVQVGSGATSITFTGLEDEPLYWSCIFKSNFGTSSGYQRVIWNISGFSDGVPDIDAAIGMCMDSSAHFSGAYWTSSYSNGSLTITSNGTNAGGYFHQPGYYQLTYAYDATGNYQSKTVTPTTSQQVITADSQYDALKKVTVEAIPSTYVQPTATQGATTYRASTTQQTIASGTYLSGTQTIAAVSQTNLSAENIKSGTTISISNGQNNIWSVTGTYEGSGSSGIGTLLATHSIGSVSTSSTSAANLNSDVSVSGINNYDLLIVETSVNTKTNNRHAATIRLIWLTASSTIGTKNGATLPSNTMNIRLSSNGTATSNQSTTQYGIYPYSCTISNGNATIVMYRRYNNSATGTINGTYTTRVYGVNLYDLIGG